MLFAKKNNYSVYLIIFWSLFWFCTSSCLNPKKKTQATISPLASLGRYLFYDNHLSLNHSKSCGSCHAPEFAFTDGYRRSVSPMGENLKHNSPSLLNTQTNQYYDWANPLAKTYRQQMQRPLYGKHPVELGLDMHFDKVKKYIVQDENYQTLWRKAFKADTNAVSMKNIEIALEAYLNTLVSTNSKYDQYIQGDTRIFSSAEKHGLKLFRSEALSCSKCHPEPSFTLATKEVNMAQIYVNIGLCDYTALLSAKDSDLGLYENTQNLQDLGKFKIPSLRNCGITAPYMHDGSVASLSEVIDTYQNGGRIQTSSNSLSKYKTSETKHPFIQGFELSAIDKQSLIAFLQTLTDTSYLSQEHFLNPFRIR